MSKRSSGADTTRPDGMQESLRLVIPPLAAQLGTFAEFQEFCNGLLSTRHEMNPEIHGPAVFLND